MLRRGGRKRIVAFTLTAAFLIGFGYIALDKLAFVKHLYNVKREFSRLEYSGLYVVPTTTRTLELQDCQGRADLMTIGSEIEISVPVAEVKSVSGDDQAQLVNYGNGKKVALLAGLDSNVDATLVIDHKDVTDLRSLLGFILNVTPDDLTVWSSARVQVAIIVALQLKTTLVPKNATTGFRVPLGGGVVAYQFGNATNDIEAIYVIAIDAQERHILLTFSGFNRSEMDCILGTLRSNDMPIQGDVLLRPMPAPVVEAATL
jgi:hypothetical protein